MDPQDRRTESDGVAIGSATAAQPAAQLDPDGSLPLSGLPLAPVPDRVDPTGIMFRGAPRTQRGPAMPYSITQRELVWADNLPELIERAKRRQWNATTDIPWAAGQNEIHPAYTEAGIFLSTQVVDEARHVEAFLKRLYLNGVGLREVSPGTESSIKGLLMQEDFARASFLLHVLGEGTFTDLFHLLIEISPDEATRQIMVRSLEDEARHVAYGVGRLRTQLSGQKDPDLLGQQFVEALEGRLSFTYEVSGLPPQVQEALAILAGGGRSPAAQGRGVPRIRQFIAELNESRKRRLLQAGFSEQVAEHISQLHVRSSGGLM